MLNDDRDQTTTIEDVIEVQQSFHFVRLTATKIKFEMFFDLIDEKREKKTNF